MNKKSNSILVVIAFLIYFIFSGGLQAAEFEVSDITSLRNALTNANSNGEDDVIRVNAGVYQITGPSNEDGGLTGDLDSRSNLTIIGAGARNTILEGNGEDRIIDVRANIISSNI